MMKPNPLVKPRKSGLAKRPEINLTKKSHKQRSQINMHNYTIPIGSNGMFEEITVQPSSVEAQIIPMPVVIGSFKVDGVGGTKGTKKTCSRADSLHAVAPAISKCYQLSTGVTGLPALATVLDLELERYLLTAGLNDSAEAALRGLFARLPLKPTCRRIRRTTGLAGENGCVRTSGGAQVASPNCQPHFSTSA